LCKITLKEDLNLMRYFLFFVLSLSVYATEETSLQAKLLTTQETSQVKITPGNPMKIIAVVKNSGQFTSGKAKLFIRFVFPEPLEKEPNSLLFVSDKLPIPPLLPGQEIAIPFNFSRNWPSLFDFVRYDWGVRQFQAVLVADSKESVIGTLSIVFSAYYYDGPSKEIPQKIPSKTDTKKTKPLLKS
jgi:hypothetical protein